MKRILDTLVLILFAGQIFSQTSFVQRIVFPAVDVLIQAGASTANIQSYCFDLYRESPSNLTSFKSVLLDGEGEIIIGNNNPITIQEALDKGYIEFVGNNFTHFQVKNNTSENLRFHTKDYTGIGNVPNDTRGLNKDFFTKSNLQKIENNGRLWDSRKKHEFEEEKITVYQYEKLLNTNNPTDEELANTDKTFKAKYKIVSEYELEEKIYDLYYEMKNQSKLKGEKVSVYQYEKLLNTNNPTDDELANADKVFKAKYKIVSDYDLKNKIYDLYDEMKLQSELKQEKVSVYQYEKLLNTNNPTDDELANADKAFKTKHKIFSDYEFKNKIYDLYDEMKVKSELKQEKIPVYKSENLLTNDNPTDEELANADKAFKTKYKIVSEYELIEKVYALSDEMKLQEDYANKLISAITNGANSSTETLHTFESELRLPLSNSIQESKAQETLAYYYRHIYAFIQHDPDMTATDFINKVKQFKNKIGLTPNFMIDQATKKYFDDLSLVLENEQIDLSRGLNTRDYNDHIYLVNENYLDLGTQLFEIDLLNKSVKPLDQYKGVDCRINQIGNDLFLVDNKFVDVNNLYSEIKNSDFYQESNSVSFGKDVSETSKQGIVRTLQIKEITASGRDIEYMTPITSKVYDFSSLRSINIKRTIYNRSDIDFSINKKSSPPPGSGIVGRLKFVIYDIANNKIPGVNNKIINLFTRMRANENLNFASELKNDLKAYNIDVQSIKINLSNISIVLIEKNNSSLTAKEICLNDNNYKSK